MVEKIISSGIKRRDDGNSPGHDRTILGNPWAKRLLYTIPGTSRLAPSKRRALFRGWFSRRRDQRFHGSLLNTGADPCRHGNSPEKRDVGSNATLGCFFIHELHRGQHIGLRTMSIPPAAEPHSLPCSRTSSRQMTK